MWILHAWEARKTTFSKINIISSNKDTGADTWRFVRPITPKTTAGNMYIFVLVDDHSRYMWSILLKEKSEAFVKFKKFKEIVERDSRAKTQTFRTDRGGEFVSHEFNKFCDDSGIKRHLTAPYTPTTERSG